MTRAFHVALHALPADEIPEQDGSIEGRQVKCIQLAPQHLIQPLEISFEAAVESLSLLPRMFVEPDGSFVWVGEAPAWQLNGVLFDRGGQLQYVELHGTCTAESFESLVKIFRSDQTSLAIQLMQQAVFLSEKEFRRLIWDL